MVGNSFPTHLQHKHSDCKKKKRETTNKNACINQKQ